MWKMTMSRKYSPVAGVATRVQLALSNREIFSFSLFSGSRLSGYEIIRDISKTM